MRSCRFSTLILSKIEKIGNLGEHLAGSQARTAYTALCVVVKNKTAHKGGLIFLVIYFSDSNSSILGSPTDLYILPLADT